MHKVKIFAGERDYCWSHHRDAGQLAGMYHTEVISDSAHNIICPNFRMPTLFQDTMTQLMGWGRGEGNDDSICQFLDLSDDHAFFQDTMHIYR